MGQTGNGQSDACSDPLLAGSSACNVQSQQNPTSGMQGIQFPQPSATRPQVPSFYNDTEGLTTQNYATGQTSRYYSSFQRSLPPEPLTELQRFVASTTGEILPIYGADLFRNIPSTFAPVENAPVPSDFVIGPDDELRIRVWGQVSFSSNVRVDRSGDIFLPHVGPVHVAGLRFGQVEGQLRDAIARVYRNFDLTVNMGQIRSIQVYLAGQARRPGVYTVSSLSTLVDALFAAGGPSIQGSLRHIELRRDGVVVTDFDLYDLLIHGDKSKDVKLLPGDVIYIPSVGPQVALTGSVRVPGIYELRGTETISSLLADAGGTTSVAAASRILIERIDNHRDRHAMQVAYDKAGLATPLADGDVLRIESILPSYAKTVTLRGNVANPGRFAWHPGMHVSDLIPDKESLISRNYWWRRAQLGLPAPEFEPAIGSNILRQPTEPIPAPGTRAQQALYSQSRNSESGYLQEQSAMNAQAVRNQVASGQPDQSGTVEAYPPGSGNPSGYDLSNNFGDNRQPGAGSGWNRALASQQPSALSNNRAGVPRSSNDRSRDAMYVLIPEIDWAYASIERQNPANLKTEVLGFDLGKLILQHDGSQDLELQPGDIVTVFSEADIRLPLAQQTKVVTLEGEFLHAGSYTVKPGETLRQLVERAGGLTSAAYLYGSQFTRESTRAIQQARMDDYIQSLEMQMQRGNITLAASGVADPTQLAGNSATQSSERDIVGRLRQIRATGRIVLEFSPSTSGVAAVPEIALENGDTFVVPSVPAAVNVVGAVYNQNSFLYSTRRRVRDYLHLAGGPNRDADYHHAFIIRADGEVIGRASYSGAWGNSFDSLRLYPGDTIVVPDKSIKPPALRTLADWSNVFSQLAVGAATINLLR